MEQLDAEYVINKGTINRDAQLSWKDIKNIKN